MSKINAVKIGNTVNVSLNGKLYKKNCGVPEIANELYKMVLETQKDPTDENIAKILGYINERTRIAMECGLETDPINGEVYLAGFNTPVPMTLIEVVKDYHENGFPVEAIINFWKLLMLNPDKRVRTSLFDFINTHDFVLTDEGYMVVYKAVYYKTKDENDLSEFITNQYLHVKKNWGCSPNKYVVYRNSENQLFITKEVTANNWDEKEKQVEILGKLGDMFNDIDKYIEDSETMYTDMYTRKMEIKLGEPVLMDRTDCDADPTIDCSYGLHVGATNYVSRFGEASGAVLVCLVNPANVVAVPDYDHSKMRVAEYYPFAIATYDGSEIDVIEEPYFEHGYSHYEETKLAEMIEKVRNEEPPIETAMYATEETRDMDELQKIIEARMIDISK